MIVLRILGYIWAAPLTLVGLLLYAILGGWRGMRWRDGVLEAIPKRIPGMANTVAQTWGWSIWYLDEKWRALPSLRRHERVHVRQAMILGPFFAALYVGNFLINLAIYRNAQKAYEEIWFERMARRAE